MHAANDGAWTGRSFWFWHLQSAQLTTGIDEDIFCVVDVIYLFSVCVFCVYSYESLCVCTRLCAHVYVHLSKHTDHSTGHTSDFLALVSCLASKAVPVAVTAACWRVNPTHSPPATQDPSLVRHHQMPRKSTHSHGALPINHVPQGASDPSDHSRAEQFPR